MGRATKRGYSYLVAILITFFLVFCFNAGDLRVNPPLQQGTAAVVGWFTSAADVILFFFFFFFCRDSLPMFFFFMAYGPGGLPE